MHLSKLTIENFRCFGDGEETFELELGPGLTALVGENDSGKTAVIDALRFALGTTDQERLWLDDTDFHGKEASRQIRIVCRFNELSAADKRAFLEYLTYPPDKPEEPVLYVNWTAKGAEETRRGRGNRRVEVCSGAKGDGPALAPEVRELLQATYLRPLRDAEQALSAGRRSRLSQVLYQTDKVKKAGTPYDPNAQITREALSNLSVVGIGDLANELLRAQGGLADARGVIEDHLAGFVLTGDALDTSLEVSGAGALDETKLRQLLEKLDLALSGPGRPGLGSDNLLFIACELLLLGQEDVGNKMLLIEEPEAHLHPQRQLRVMRYLQEQAKEKCVQILVTTHSPNLASAIHLESLVMVQKGRAFPLGPGHTRLEKSDYRFLERFLDVTKANLFFARGVMIVEGDAESILLPTLARLLGRDLTEHGVSIVNVGGVGLRRYARIFQRANLNKDGELNIPVACLTDLDVRPDCAPSILGTVNAGGDWPPVSKRRWRAKRDFKEDGLQDRRAALIDRASGQHVRTFVSDEWTLEYDLALGPRGDGGSFTGGLKDDVYVAACLAENDEAICAQGKRREQVEKEAIEGFASETQWLLVPEGGTAEEVSACFVYAKFVKGNASKAVAAQYLAERLEERFARGELTPDGLRNRLPRYLTEAIDYVTGGPPKEEVAPGQGDA